MEFDLSKTTILSFEICDECNLKQVHAKCPINQCEYDKRFGPLTVEKITKSIDEAQELGFEGYVAFHYHNEPLLELEKVQQVISAKGDVKYLLWTNGLLLSRDISANDFLNDFDCIVITCYDQNDMPFFEEIKSMYKNVKIISWEFDDRLDAYSREYVNEIGCKRVLFELPIDYYGNVHLCCFDWNNSYKIGNINETSFKEVVLGDAYQNIHKLANNKLLNRNESPEICLNCNTPWLRYTKPDIFD
ncbi:MAG: SPASM domain-containing protein [Halanaerobiales bacterium]|nr:SPASM domain-containing protein [Halanaerobiales bacterium]